MNKECPFCKKRVTKKMKHVFLDGQRYHQNCADNIGRVEQIRTARKKNQPLPITQQDWNDWFRGTDEDLSEFY